MSDQQPIFYTNVFTWGNTVYFKGYRGRERYIEQIDNFCPEFFVPTQGGSRFRAMDGSPLRRVVFRGGIKEARGFVEARSNMDEPVYGIKNYGFQFLQRNFGEPIQYDYDLVRIGNIDIETACEEGFPDPTEADQPVQVIVMTVHGRRIVWSLKHVEIPDAEVRVFPDDASLLINFAQEFRAQDLDILTGFNIRQFDVPYLVNRMRRLGLEPEEMSDFGIIQERTYRGDWGDVPTFDIKGVTILDMRELFLDMKYAPDKYEGTSLDEIATAELGEGKHSVSDFGSLRDLYHSDWQRYVEYCCQDVDLVDRLEAKRRLIRLVVSIAFEAKIPLDMVFMATKIWESICYDHLYRQGIVAEIQYGEFSSDFMGGYNKDTITGFYRDIVSFDATSLYPSILRTFNISPDTLVGRPTRTVPVDMLLDAQDRGDPRPLLAANPRSGECYTANAAAFSTVRKGFVPLLLEKVIGERAVAKRRMLELEREIEEQGDPDGSRKAQISILNVVQATKKVLANSFYGCLGTPSFTFYDHVLAEAVTNTGQLIIRTAERRINGYLNGIAGGPRRDYVVHIDTDSLYINLGDIVGTSGRTLDELIAGIQEELRDAMAGFARAYGCTENFLSFKKEIVATTGFFGLKKRYALNVVEKEGVRYAKPKPKITGYEPRRTTAAMVVRKKLEEAIVTILNGTNDDLLDLIEGFRKEFWEFPVARASSLIGCSELDKWADQDLIFKKGTPWHIKAALTYNHELRRRGLAEKYRSIYQGDKIRVARLKIPNPYGLDGAGNYIGFMGDPPPEMEIEKFFDRQAQWEKVFLNPVTDYCNTVGWRPSRAVQPTNLF